MKSQTLRFLVSLLVLCPASGLAADAPTTTALRCGHLLDPASGKTTENAVVLVRDGRIVAVGSGVAIPSGGAGTKTIDLSRFTCLPGLIDSHTHVLLQPEDERGAPPVVTKSIAFRTVQGVAVPSCCAWRRRSAPSSPARPRTSSRWRAIR